MYLVKLDNKDFFTVNSLEELTNVLNRYMDYGPYIIDHLSEVEYGNFCLGKAEGCHDLYYLQNCSAGYSFEGTRQQVADECERLGVEPEYVPNDEEMGYR